MNFVRYNDIDSFRSDTFGCLLEFEAQNTLLITSFKSENQISRKHFTKIFEEKGWSNTKEGNELLNMIIAKFWDDPKYILATVKDTEGSVVLTAASTYSSDKLVLFETGNRPNCEAVRLLSEGLKEAGFKMTAVVAETGLAQRFAREYGGSYKKHSTMNIMRLDQVNDLTDAPGFCRPLNENDLHFAPYWHKACMDECQQETETISALHLVAQGQIQIGGLRYIWENEGPVSQANISGETPNGALISNVYTPPYHRKKGYATSLVAELSRIILSRGKQFCALMTDAENAVSCGIYRKIGYYDICVVDEHRFA